MRQVTCVCTMLALALSVSLASAEELKSGLQPGENIGAFIVVKCSGALDDGVAVGKSLCYRCKYGTSPMVMVFTRETDKQLTGLVKQLDAAVAKNSKNGLKAFVNVLSDDRDAAEKVAKGISTKNVPIVVPVEYENGPADYGINPKAKMTVIYAKGGKVVASRAIGEKGLTPEERKAILGDVTKVLK